MKIPTLHGIIRRRILVNYRVDPEVVARLLPQPFVPKLHKGWAMAGICLIRLEQIRPALVPASLGLSSENAAHRIAVRWMDEQNRPCEGVYIPLRHSNSRINQLVGGKLFPGEHQSAIFDVSEQPHTIELRLRALDGSIAVDLVGREAEALPASSIFSSLKEASDFFEHGSLGYSETKEGKRLDGVRLLTHKWVVEPLEVQSVHSTYLQNLDLFPKGSVEFDCALMMRNISHEWHSAPCLEVQRPFNLSRTARITESIR